MTNMLSSVRFTLIIIILVTTSIGCSEDPILRPFYVNPLLKEYAIFQKGSFWVYSNPTGAKDTFTVDHFEREIFKDLEEEKEDERIKMWLSSTRAPDDRLVLRASTTTNHTGLTSTLEEHWENSSSKIWTLLFITNNATADTANSSLHRVASVNPVYQSYFDSLPVGDSMYYEVREYLTSNNPWPVWRETAYWARGIGCVKYYDDSNVEWNLTSYQLSQ